MTFPTIPKHPSAAGIAASLAFGLALAGGAWTGNAWVLVGAAGIGLPLVAWLAAGPGRLLLGFSIWLFAVLGALILLQGHLPALVLSLLMLAGVWLIPMLLLPLVFARSFDEWIRR